MAPLKNIAALAALFRPPTSGRRPIPWTHLTKDLERAGFSIENGRGSSRRLVGPNGEGQMAFVQPKGQTLEPISQSWWARSLDERFQFFDKFVRPFL